MRVRSSLFIVTLLVFGFLAVLSARFNKPGNTPGAVSVQKTKTEAVAGTQTSSAEVKKVIDGDTFQLNTGEKVRLIGINAPEQNQPNYSDAKKSLQNMVLGKSIDLQFDVAKKDRYGRLLAYVYAGNVFVNLKQVETGEAVIETIPPNVKYAGEFASAQKSARDNCKGIWQGLCNQTATSCVQIASINPDPKGPDAAVKNSEWVEIVNTCSEIRSVSGYLIKDSSAGNSYIFKNLTLFPKQKVKLHSGCGTDTAIDVYWQCPEKKSMVWNNSGDTAYLYDNTGKMVSEMSY